jgi:major membrane immunogen (membrane-anchored lipoprotein)
MRTKFFWGGLGALMVAALAMVIALAGCSSPKYKDGAYEASLSGFSDSGWKDIMELTIKNGKITAINWDAVYVDESIPIRKKQYSKSGLYGMLMANAVGEWYDQAIAAEQFVLENGIDALEVRPDGYTDAVTGCTIHVSDFDMLVRDCLAQARR